MGLFMVEKARPGERIARYYGELIDAVETARRRANGAQYIVRINSNQFIDAGNHKNQRGCYANDGGRDNNAKISVGPTPNRCPVTGEYWVSITAKRAIKAGAEVFVPYGRDYKRPWRAAPAMA